LIFSKPGQPKHYNKAYFPGLADEGRPSTPLPGFSVNLLTKRRKNNLPWHHRKIKVDEWPKAAMNKGEPGQEVIRDSADLTYICNHSKLQSYF